MNLSNFLLFRIGMTTLCQTQEDFVENELF